MGEAEEAEGARPCRGVGAPPEGVTAETQQRGFTRFDFQVEIGQPFGHGGQEGVGIGLVLEAGNVIVGVANQVGFAGTAPGETFFEPEVEYVVQVDIGVFPASVRACRALACEDR